MKDSDHSDFRRSIRLDENNQKSSKASKSGDSEENENEFPQIAWSD